MGHVIHENRGHPRDSRTRLRRPRGPRANETVDAVRPEHRPRNTRAVPARDWMEGNAQGGKANDGIRHSGRLVPAAVAAWAPGRREGDEGTDDVHARLEGGWHGGPL